MGHRPHVFNETVAVRGHGAEAGGQTDDPSLSLELNVYMLSFCHFFFWFFNPSIRKFTDYYSPCLMNRYEIECNVPFLLPFWNTLTLFGNHKILIIRFDSKQSELFPH